MCVRYLLFGIKSYTSVMMWNLGTEVAFQAARSVSILSFKCTLPSTFKQELTKYPLYLYSGLCYGQIMCVPRILVLSLPVGNFDERNSVASRTCKLLTQSQRFKIHRINSSSHVTVR